MAGKSTARSAVGILNGLTVTPDVMTVISTKKTYFGMTSANLFRAMNAMGEEARIGVRIPNAISTKFAASFLNLNSKWYEQNRRPVG